MFPVYMQVPIGEADSPQGAMHKIENSFSENGFPLPVTFVFTFGDIKFDITASPAEPQTTRTEPDRDGDVNRKRRHAPPA